MLLTTEDMFLHLCEYLGGALLHFFEMTLLKFLQPHPVALRDKRALHKHLSVMDFIYLYLVSKLVG